jgi:hypothetical protein
MSATKGRRVPEHLFVTQGQYRTRACGQPFDHQEGTPPRLGDRRSGLGGGSAQVFSRRLLCPWAPARNIFVHAWERVHTQTRAFWRPLTR